MVGRVSTTLGITPMEVGDMPWLDVMELYEYWLHSPPLHELAAAWLQYQPPPQEVEDGAARGEVDGVNFHDLKKMFDLGKPVSSL